MLYLVKSAGYDEKGGYIDLLKIGYAEDVAFRMTAYKLHNPTCKLLKTIEGTLLDEARVQYHFRKYRFSGYGKEWFVYNEEIVDFFNSSPDLSTLEDFDGLKKIRKYLSNFIKKIIQIYFLSEVFSIERRNFSDFKTIEEKVEPIYDLIGITIGTSSDVIEELSKILEIDIKTLKRLTKSYSGIKEVDQVLREFRKLTQFPDKMKLICTSDLNEDNRNRLLQKVPIEFSKYYYILGPDQCKAVSYRKSLLEDKLNLIEPKKNLGMIDTIYGEFLPGQRYLKSDIKKKLGEIYKEYDYEKTAKACDLEEYFKIKTCLIPNKETGKRDQGFEIVKSWNSIEESTADAIYEKFEVGKRYSKSLIKEKLTKIYSDFRYDKTAKASDLEEYFELKSCLISNKETGKRDNGFEIIKKR